MKSKLPILLFGVGLLLVVGLFVMRGRGGAVTPEEEDAPELPVSQRPYTQLVPTEDGHYLNLIVSNINVPNAESMDYELYYGTAEGITQGVPGKVKLEGKSMIEMPPLLLGSESSGKFRYDEGVNDGTLTLRFRDADGKMIGKVAGQWTLSSETDMLTSLDGEFKYTLDEASEAFFVVMPTFGVPESAPADVSSGPYGVFASVEDEFPGTVNFTGNVQMWDGTSWNSVSGSSDNIGVFIATS